MALTESIEYDKIEVVGQYKHVQVRKATVIKRDGTEVTRSFERFALNPGTLDASKVPHSNVYLSKDLVSSTSSFLMTVAFLTCTALYWPTTSILSYSMDSESAIRINLRLKQV